MRKKPISASTLLLLAELTLLSITCVTKPESRDGLPLLRNWHAVTNQPQQLGSSGPLFTLTFGALNATCVRIPSHNSSFLYILVNQSLWSDVDIQTRIFRYAEDVESTGLGVFIFSLTDGNPEDIRSLLQSAEDDLVGCLLVGNIPVAWYEMTCDWGDSIEHEEFPIDLFYMDLDGVWTDSDADGIYDGHNGHKPPEIWVGRLEASKMAEPETSLIKNYFDKNHAYRTGYLSLPERALLYIDDDWKRRARDTYVAAGTAYSNITLVTNRATTNKTDYLHRLTQGWSLVHLKCHGKSDRHTFEIPNATDPSKSVWESSSVLGNRDVRSWNPAALFYNLFACEGARFTEKDYIGGWYIFTQTYGLVAVGSTKTGGMQTDTEQLFYNHLSSGEILGEVFKEWFITFGEEDPKWTYGMVILGDPTISISAPDEAGFQTDLNMDGTVNILDICMVAKAYHTKPGDLKWNAIADLDKNGIINILDLSLVARDAF